MSRVPSTVQGQRAGGSVTGAVWGELQQIWEEKGGVESLKVSSIGSTSCSPPSFPATRGDR